MISFLVMGHIDQVITPREGYTEKQIVDLLNEGEAFTTLHDAHAIILLEGGMEKVIDDIDDTDNYCEYTDFEVREE